MEDTLRDSSYAQYKARTYPRFTLSKYSPCVNTGNPAKAFKDVNGSRSDRGLFGGPKKFLRSVQ